MASSTVFTSQNITASEAERTPRFGKLFTSGLGSPFLTTADLPGDDDVANADTNAGNAELDLEDVDGAFAAVPRAFTITRPVSPTPSFRTENYSIINWDATTFATIYGSGDRTPRCSAAFLPSSRRTLAGYPYCPPSSPTQLKSSRSLTLGIIPRIWDALREGSPGKKGKRRPGLPSASAWRESGWVVDTYDSDECVDYSSMLPLDGEEGELIDDEACFIDIRAVTGVDIVALLPPELALHLLSFLDLPAIIACLRVSRTWNRLADDNSIWCTLFSQREADGWRADLRRAHSASPALLYPSLSSSRALLPAPLEIDWYETYRTRTELDRRWSVAPNSKSSTSQSWEPVVRRISGHRDSVYCLEFDSSRIITGSRDLTIKVWSLKTGRCLGSFAGHRGSVLCLKFDKDWDTVDNVGEDDDEDVQTARVRKGFLVSGSSDCSVCVWDLSVLRPADGEVQGEQPVTAEVRAVLKGHSGGVLDLRIDSNWIVSCSKDALIRVWDRKTLGLHCTLRGHEGPVNAVGLQGHRVVSASGDGKMMLWDIATGERLRTFEGHDRGLACIEFKDDLIVSGSNDCKIKVWSASTGTCLRTLVGHEMLVRALSFDPRSGRLVSGSYDKTVKVWDLHTGRMVREFRGCHESHIFDVKFDHCRIVSTSHDQHIIILDFSEGLDVSLFV
ncbi:F-box/WD repeat-containing protein [Sparassis crispa]|uniref:F-box/WD repeat-containing protein n=1 Tax=Sparassis crispa TaxID=139825 RepID=A0A401GNW9_9APHY|nr:F-box/WD repeat-containing protein [Sparassis crispa]GBE83444.1 F-box/WD repeat-containing protein [Sparassis crispa]